MPLESPRRDICKTVKSEIRSVLEEELTGLKANVAAVDTELQSLRSSVTTEITTLKTTTAEMEGGLSTCYYAEK